MDRNPKDDQDIIEVQFTSQTRAKVCREQEENLRARVRTNPQKNAFETDLNLYTEELDPQVKDAVIAMHTHGYTTIGSGFWGKDNHQTILGEFRLNEELKSKLSEIGVIADEYTEFGIECTDLNFSSYPLTLEEMKTKWDQAAAILPPTGQKAKPSVVWQHYMNNESSDKIYSKN